MRLSCSSALALVVLGSSLSASRAFAQGPCKCGYQSYRNGSWDAACTWVGGDPPNPPCEPSCGWPPLFCNDREVSHNVTGAGSAAEVLVHDTGSLSGSGQITSLDVDNGGTISGDFTCQQLSLGGILASGSIITEDAHLSHAHLLGGVITTNTLAITSGYLLDLGNTPVNFSRLRRITNGARVIAPAGIPLDITGELIWGNEGMISGPGGARAIGATIVAVGGTPGDTAVLDTSLDLDSDSVLDLTGGAMLLT